MLTISISMRIRWTTTREDGFLAFSYSFLLWAIVAVAAATGGVDSFVVRCSFLLGSPCREEKAQIQEGKWNKKKIGWHGPLGAKGAIGAQSSWGKVDKGGEKVNKVANCPNENRKVKQSYSGMPRLGCDTCLHLVSRDTLQSLSGRKHKQACLFVCLFPYIMFQKGFQASPTPISPPHCPTAFELLTIQMAF